MWVVLVSCTKKFLSSIMLLLQWLNQQFSGCSVLVAENYLFNTMVLQWWFSPTMLWAELARCTNLCVALKVCCTVFWAELDECTKLLQPVWWCWTDNCDKIFWTQRAGCTKRSIRPTQAAMNVTGVNPLHKTLFRTFWIRQKLLLVY